MNDRFTTKLMALVGALLLSGTVEADFNDEQRTDCVWPAAAGAVGGVTIAWYGYVGATALRGRSAFDLEATPGNVALILGIETVGLVGGSVVGCRVWGHDGRWYPTAGSVVLGGVVAGTAAWMVAYWAIDRSGLDSDTDSPVLSSLTLLLSTTAGVAGGGYLGYRLDRALRGGPAVLPIADRQSVGLRVALRF